jgi:hypothetical protein
MFEWQLAIGARFATNARTLRIAWLLQSLCLKEGYAYATDGYISRTLSIQKTNVQAALTELERAGAIIRASVFVEGQAQRRIWPSIEIIPLTARGMDTPHGDTRDTPHGEGTDSLGRERTMRRARMSATQEDAKRDAERRAKKHTTLQ